MKFIQFLYETSTLIKDIDMYSFILMLIATHTKAVKTFLGIKAV